MTLDGLDYFAEASYHLVIILVHVRYVCMSSGFWGFFFSLKNGFMLFQLNAELQEDHNHAATVKVSPTTLHALCIAPVSIKMVGFPKNWLHITLTGCTRIIVYLNTSLTSIRALLVNFVIKLPLSSGDEVRDLH